MRARALGDYAAIIASKEKILIIGKGELLLLATDGDQKIVAQQRLFKEKVNLYSHPALVGKRLFIRGEFSLRCVRL